MRVFEPIQIRNVEVLNTIVAARNGSVFASAAIRAKTASAGIPRTVSTVPSLTGVVGDPVMVEQIGDVVTALVS